MIKLLIALLAFAPLTAIASGNWAPDAVGVSNMSTFTCNGSSTQAMAYNAARAYLFIQNSGATNAVTLTFGRAATGSEGVTLGAGIAYEPHPNIVNSIYCKSASGTTINIIEGLK